MAGRRRLLRIAATSQVVRPFPRAGSDSKSQTAESLPQRGRLSVRASGRDRALDVVVGGVVGGGGQSGGRLGLAGGAPIRRRFVRNQDSRAHVHFARSAALRFQLVIEGFRDVVRDTECRDSVSGGGQVLIQIRRTVFELSEGSSGGARACIALRERLPVARTLRPVTSGRAIASSSIKIHGRRYGARKIPAGEVRGGFGVS
jgi:hypothetical protein